MARKLFNIAWKLKKQAKEDLEKAPVEDPTAPSASDQGPQNAPTDAAGTNSFQNAPLSDIANIPLPTFENNEPVDDRTPVDWDALDEPYASNYPGEETVDQISDAEYNENNGLNSTLDALSTISASNAATAEATAALKSALTRDTLHGKLESGETVNKIPSNSGTLHTAIPQAAISWMQTPSEMRVAHNNAAIRLGPDMPHDELSGYGRDGAQHCDTIDLCAGFGQAENDGEGYEHGTIAKNNIITDAARIYVSALTDIDDNFSLANGTIGKSIGASGIGIKADAVRIIGRQSIKIVTGKMRGTNETASNGAKLGTRAGIDLIAGNYTGSKKLKLPEGGSIQLNALQPAVMGDNLMAALEQVEEHVDALRQALLAQSVTTLMCLGGMAPGLTAWAPTAGAATPIPGMVRKSITDVVLPMYALFIRQIFWRWKFLNAKTDRYICSKNVRLT